MAITNRDLQAGTKLVARFKGQEHTVLVLGDKEAGVSYELDGGTTYKSLSSAGSAVMNGTACNGWRFWSLEGELPAKPEKGPKAKATKNAPGKLLRQISRVPNQKGVEEGSTKWHCSSCMASFVAEGKDAPEACTKGHPREVKDEFATAE